MSEEKMNEEEEKPAVRVLVCPRCARRWRVAASQLARPRKVRCSGCNESWQAHAGEGAPVSPPKPETTPPAKPEPAKPEPAKPEQKESAQAAKPQDPQIPSKPPATPKPEVKPEAEPEVKPEAQPETKPASQPIIAQTPAATTSSDEPDDAEAIKVVAKPSLVKKPKESFSWRRFFGFGLLAVLVIVLLIALYDGWRHDYPTILQDEGVLAVFSRFGETIVELVRWLSDLRQMLFP